jgi:EAL domain-containing protein (putative c-di-GMP-specific phosphodiesterase class I)
MHTALSMALKQGELFALYQPQLAIDGLHVVCAEALLRWQRPGMGLINPDDFVPFAEHNALIDELGSFILERACQTAAHWGDLPVSINVSPLQFAQTGLDDSIFEVARRAGLPLNRLEIEITETAPFADLAAARAMIERLRAHGVTVSLDDLGSGYATTCLMRDLPVDRVKLAKSIVDLVVTSAGAEGIAKIVAQARELGLNVTAEGVETAEQLARLKACGCDRVQGFLFARPMSAGELSTFAGLTLG